MAPQLDHASLLVRWHRNMVFLLLLLLLLYKCSSGHVHIAVMHVGCCSLVQATTLLSF